MSILCHLRAFVFVECWCQFCRYSRRLDALIADEELRQAGERVNHRQGFYR